MTTKAYKRRIAASKADLDAELRACAKRFGHHGPDQFIEIARQYCHTAITREYAEELIRGAQ